LRLPEPDEDVVSVEIFEGIVYVATSTRIFLVVGDEVR
jgi:hypothetical protein